MFALGEKSMRQGYKLIVEISTLLTTLMKALTLAAGSSLPQGRHIEGGSVMRTLVRWDPFAEFAGLKQAFDQTLWRAPSGRTHRFDLTPAIDLSETDGEVVVKASLPGVKAEDVDISVNDGILTVKGERKFQEEAEGENYYRREIRYGSFSRSIPLPSLVNHEQADAEFKDGVLTVTLPKAEEVRPKQIKIRANGATADTVAGDTTEQPIGSTN
jgi:HSP20 family protein